MTVTRSLFGRLGALAASLAVAVGGLVAGAAPAQAAVDIYVTEGTFTVNGRQWRTECDTATTGRGGCRTYIEATVIAKVGAGYQWRTQWTLNNIVRFGPSTPPAKPSLAFIKDANLRACVADALKGADPKTLTYLDCDDKGVATLAGVEQLTALQGLGAQGGSITDLSPVKGLQLQQLAFGGNNVESLAPLAGMTSLKLLEASSNEIHNLAPLKGLDLEWVDLTSNQIEDVSPLAGNPNLYTLVLNDNLIEDLSALTDLPSLRILGLAENIIEDVSPLATFTTLEELELGANWITDVTALAGLQRLEGLYLEANELGDVAPLKGLTNLEELTLAENPEITNLEQLKPLVDAGLIIDIWED